MAKKAAKIEVFKLNYYVTNNGDGSASVRFCESAKIAEKLDEEQDEGWGESSASDFELKIENGEIYCRAYDHAKHKYDWHKLEKEIRNEGS